MLTAAVVVTVSVLFVLVLNLMMTWAKYEPILDQLQSGQMALVEDHAFDPQTGESVLIHPKLLGMARDRVAMYEAAVWNAMIRKWSAGEMLLFFTDRGDISRFGPLESAKKEVDPVITATYLTDDQFNNPLSYGLSPIIPVAHANRVRGIIHQKRQAAALAPFRTLL